MNYVNGTDDASNTDSFLKKMDEQYDAVNVAK